MLQSNITNCRRTGGNHGNGLSSHHPSYSDNQNNLMSKVACTAGSPACMSLYQHLFSYLDIASRPHLLDISLQTLYSESNTHPRFPDRTLIYATASQQSDQDLWPEQRPDANQLCSRKRRTDCHCRP